MNPISNAGLFAALLLSSATAAASPYSDDFSAPLDPDQWLVSEPLRGSSATAPVADSKAGDGQVLQLIYPGGTGRQISGPGYSTAVETPQTHGYGSYSARFKAATAGRNEGLISAFFTYFNDGSDADGDGIADNSEIDFELLAAEPSVLYLSVWTDYEVVDGVERFYHSSRKIDLATGRVWQTPPGGEGEYGYVEMAPQEWTAPSFNAAVAYAQYGFDWQADSVRFWIDLEDGAGPRTLWTLTGTPDVSIPTRPALTMFNLWHNAYAWDSNRRARPPAQDGEFRVDRVQIP
jgi:beta-glucanase (GH16 family)